MRRPTRQQIGCLASLGIAAILVGMILPSVGMLRDVAARTSCNGQLGQLTLALHNYADSSRGKPSAFPPATIPNPTLPVDQRLSWMVDIFPFMEQDAVHKRADLQSGWASPPNAAMLGVVCKPYRCPIIDRNDPRPVTTYVGVTGVGPDSPTLPQGHPRAGVFAYDRPTPLWTIKDGTSYTILVMEYGREYVPWARGGEGTLAWFDPADPPHAGAGRPLGLPHGARSWGPIVRQGDTGILGMADGSRRTVTIRISPHVLEAIATIAGGESVPRE